MKVSGIQKFQLSKHLVKKPIQAKIKKFQYSISFMNWKKLRSPTRAALTNPSFQSFCKLGKSLKYSLRNTFKNPHFESKDELNIILCPTLSFTVENKGNLHKIRLL